MQGRRNESTLAMACASALAVAQRAIAAGHPEGSGSGDVRFASASRNREATAERHRKLENAADYVLTFGKHRGRMLREIERDDPDYLNWLAQRSKCPKFVRERVKTFLRLLDSANSNP